MDWKNTTARSYAYYLNGHLRTGGLSLITPSGDLYAGAGRDNENFVKNTMEGNQAFRFYGDFDTRISENWENIVRLGQWNLHRYGPVALVTGDNFDTGMETFLTRLNNIHYAYWAFLDDFQGHYNWGPIKNTDAFGGGWSEYSVDQRTWADTAMPGYTAPVVPFSNAAAINAIRVPGWNQYNAAYYPAQGLHNETVDTSIYYQHTIDIVPNYVTLVAGWTWADITTEGTANLSLLPFTTITTPAEQWLHRYGMKTDFLGGRISTDFAWFQLTTTNVLSVGGRWISTSGLTYAEFPAFTQWSGEIKLYTGTLVDAFINYRVNKHLQLKLSGVNLLNDTYVAGEQTAQIADPSQPVGATLELEYKL